ncbi:hypothetical protein HPP92_011218 [Vanilla planifolia]|uniref:Epidermal patterning factor-like protein n=1 Tax=Vanilla planifolia TaxID=51239 RepID=A0A835R2E7_VANPL|nr:hypothetical protein HPP92_011218 [Vanilla planifolia]
MGSLTMSHGLHSYLALFNLLLLFLQSSSASRMDQQWSPPSSHLDKVEEEKVRLGSTPPSCRNRCRACNPCEAVQVPTPPASTGLRDRLGAKKPQPVFSQLNSNYKPLEWKCSCGGRLFNP